MNPISSRTTGISAPLPTAKDDPSTSVSNQWQSLGPAFVRMGDDDVRITSFQTSPRARTGGDEEVLFTLQPVNITGESYITNVKLDAEGFTSLLGYTDGREIMPFPQKMTAEETQVFLESFRNGMPGVDLPQGDSAQEWLQALSQIGNGVVPQPREDGRSTFEG
jgi:hypothetical protein